MTAAGLPDAPVGRRVAWVLERIARQDADVESVTDAFAPSFLEAVPARRVIDVLATLRYLSGATVEHLVGSLVKRA